MRKPRKRRAPRKTKMYKEYNNPNKLLFKDPNCMNDTYMPYMSFRDMAQESGMSEKEVREGYEELVKIGFIKPDPDNSDSDGISGVFMPEDRHEKKKGIEV